MMSSFARITPEPPAATADEVVLPGALGSRTLRHTGEVRLRSISVVPGDGCPAARGYLYHLVTASRA
jgi:hypothetical protein